EIPSPAAGVLQRIVAGEDETVEVGGELAVIGDADEAPADSGPADSGPADSGPADSAGDTVQPTAGAPAEEVGDAEPAPAPAPAEQEQPAAAPQAAAAPAAEGTAVRMPELGESVTE